MYKTLEKLMLFKHKVSHASSGYPEPCLTLTVIKDETQRLTRTLKVGAEDRGGILSIVLIQHYVLLISY